jgi:hypothetical protein
MLHWDVSAYRKSFRASFVLGSNCSPGSVRKMTYASSGTLVTIAQNSSSTASAGVAVERTRIAISIFFMAVKSTSSHRTGIWRLRLRSVGQEKKIDGFIEWKNSREHDRYQQSSERKRADGD